MQRQHTTGEFNDAASVGNFSADFKIKDAPAGINRQFSAVSDSMLADVFNMLTELKSKVDLIAAPGDISRIKTDSARIAAPGPTNLFLPEKA